MPDGANNHMSSLSAEMFRHELSVRRWIIADPSVVRRATIRKVLEASWSRESVWHTTILASFGFVLCLCCSLSLSCSLSAVVVPSMWLSDPSPRHFGIHHVHTKIQARSCSLLRDDTRNATIHLLSTTTPNRREPSDEHDKSKEEAPQHQRDSFPLPHATTKQQRTGKENAKPMGCLSIKMIEPLV